MGIPSEKDILFPLLHVIHEMGGQGKPADICDKLAMIFGLTEEERQRMQPSGVARKFDNRVAWARYILCVQGLLDKSTHGIWKITGKGEKEVSHFYAGGSASGIIPFQGKNPVVLPNVVRETESFDEHLLELVIRKVAPEVLKEFPDDFIEDQADTDFSVMMLPGTHLCLAPLSQVIITSQKRYFRYEAKNPAVAKYILFAYKVGDNQIKIPRDNLKMFKAVKSYERYCNDLTDRAFGLFIDLTRDETKSEVLINELAKRLGLKPRLLFQAGRNG